MTYLDEFLLIAVAHFFAVASPGPDFAVVLKQSVQQGRRNALWTSAGVGAAILSIVLCKTKVRGFFQRSGYWFDRCIGVILIALAIRVVI